jgi:hypothetical protein
MASAPNAKVICLQSHPAWAAAERRARERMESMCRHPSSQSWLRGAAPREGVGGRDALVRGLRVCRGDTVLEFPPRNHIC